MPKYVYECESCEEVFEVRHSMSEKAESCVKCGKSDIKKKITDFTLESKKETHTGNIAGTEVKKFIEETKEEIKGERETLSSRIIK